MINVVGAAGTDSDRKGSGYDVFVPTPVSKVSDTKSTATESQHTVVSPTIAPQPVGSITPMIPVTVTPGVEAAADTVPAAADTPSPVTATTSAAPLPPTGSGDKKNVHKAIDPKKKRLNLILGAIFLILLLLGGGVAFYLSKSSQDLRQQASGLPYNCKTGPSYKCCADDPNACGGNPSQCHCLNGDLCSGTECDPDLEQQCENQGRSYCTNYQGFGTTCCAVGYECCEDTVGGDGCCKAGGPNPTNPPNEPTEPPQQTPTPTPTTPPSITPTPTTGPSPTPTNGPTPTEGPTPTNGPTPTEEPTPTLTDGPTPTLPPGVTPSATPTTTDPTVAATPTNVQPTNTPAPTTTDEQRIVDTTAECNESCTINANCENPSHVCYNGFCRLDSNPEDSSCHLPSGNTQTVVTEEQYQRQWVSDSQPASPETLPVSGPEDWLKYLKVGLGILGIGSLLLLLL